MTTLWKLLCVAVAAVGAAVLLVRSGPDIADGTGVVVATFAAGAGWLVRELVDEQRARRNLVEAYVAIIQAHWQDLRDALSDSELQRHQALADAIADGSEEPSVGARSSDPFALLPDLREKAYLLPPGVLPALLAWRDLGQTLYLAYDQIGTIALCQTGPERLRHWFGWVRDAREAYRVAGNEALRHLGRMSSEVRTGSPLADANPAPSVAKSSQPQDGGGSDKRFKAP